MRTEYPQPEAGMGFTLSYRDITGEAASLPEINNRISQLNLHAVLRWICQINNAVVETETTFPLIQTTLLGIFIHPELRAKISAIPFPPTGPYHTIFHRQQQLLLLRLALTMCVDKGSKHPTIEEQYEFGTLCLMMNDHLAAEPDPNVKSELNAASLILPLHELVSDQEAASHMARAVEWWRSLARDPATAIESSYVDLAAAFQQHYGIELDQFMHLLVAVNASAMNYELTSPEGIAKVIFTRDDYFSKPRLSKEVIDTALGLIAFEVKTYGNHLSKETRKRAEYDFITFRTRPLVEVEPHIFACFDRGFLLKLLTEGLYHLIHTASVQTESGDFQAFFGSIFARYTERVLRHIYGNSAGFTFRKLTLSPHFTSGKSGEVCDAFIDEGEDWLLIETKGVYLTPHAKYTADPEALGRDLRGKFIGKAEPKSGEAKGIAQLANSINRIRSGDHIIRKGGTATSCRRIHPVLLVPDPAVETPEIARYLDGELRTRLSNVKSKIHIEPLSIVSVDALERVACTGGRLSLPAALRAYHPIKGMTMSFALYLGLRHQELMSVEGSPLAAGVEALMDGALSGLFPDTPDLEEQG